MATYPLKKFRLKREEFREVLKKGKSFRVNGLVLKLMIKDKEKKIGFLISKKLVKKAVRRNKLKRIMREILRERVEILKEGIRAVFIPLESFEGKKPKELKKIFDIIFNKSRIIKHEPNH